MNNFFKAPVAVEKELPTMTTPIATLLEKKISRTFIPFRRVNEQSPFQQTSNLEISHYHHTFFSP